MCYYGSIKRVEEDLSSLFNCVIISTPLPHEKMTEEKLKWIKKQIADNNLHPFYTSAEWKKLAATARVEQHNECQRCKKKGYYSPCDIVHHKKYVKDYPQLALSIDNLECLCHNCHEEEHKKKKSFVNEEKW